MKLFNLINGNEIHIAPGQSIVPSEIFSQLMDAKELIDIQSQKFDRWYPSYPL